MSRSIRAVALLAAGLAALVGCSSSSKGGAGAPAPLAGSSTTSASPTPASQETLVRALLTPADLSNLGVLVVRSHDVGTGVGTTGSGSTHSITFVSGDPACKGVVSTHPVNSQTWAFVDMVNSTEPGKVSVVVDEDIDSFRDVDSAQRVMQQNRDQVSGCHTFIGDTEFADQTKQRLQFTHRQIAVPGEGDEMVAHQLVGKANGVSTITWNFVEVRSGLDVIFVDYSPSEEGLAHTVAIATKAFNKYSSTPR